MTQSARGPPPRAECPAWTLGGPGCAPSSRSPFPTPSPSPPCVAQPIKHKWNVCVLPLPGTSPCSSVHLSACGLLAKRRRIYALKLEKAVGGPLPGARPVVCAGALPVAGEAGPSARICVLAPDVVSPIESRRTKRSVVGGSTSSAALSGLSVLAGSCHRNQIHDQYRVQEGDEPSPSAASCL